MERRFQTRSRDHVSKKSIEVSATCIGSVEDLFGKSGEGSWEVVQTIGYRKRKEEKEGR